MNSIHSCKSEIYKSLTSKNNYDTFDFVVLFLFSKQQNSCFFFRSEISHIKEGEADKVKCYAAVCWSERVLTSHDIDRLNDLTDLDLQQKTPVRVLHRLNTKPFACLLF